MTSESRIDNLEAILAHQAAIIEDLSEEVRRQWQTIERLQKAEHALRERFQALEDVAGSRPEAARPPHY